MSAGGAEEGGEGGDCAEQPRQITRRTRNARRNIINRNHLSMSKRLIISWQEGCQLGVGSSAATSQSARSGAPPVVSFNVETTPLNRLARQKPKVLSGASRPMTARRR